MKNPFLIAVFLMIPMLVLFLTIPMIAYSGAKSHIKTENQDCAECHSQQSETWLDGKHGLMNVKCVVCHGSPDENFVSSPGLNRCRGCHSDKIIDVTTKLTKKEQSCFICHDNHTVAVKESAKVKAGFHK